MENEKKYCPRAVENGGGPNSPFKAPLNGEAEFDGNHRCSYCGSFSQEKFFSLIGQGHLVIPTDKNYKVYIAEGKFYFQHLSKEGKLKFIEMMNSREIYLGAPGRFYVMPFFMRID